jgi:hypothetical protein
MPFLLSDRFSQFESTSHNNPSRYVTSPDPDLTVQGGLPYLTIWHSWLFPIARSCTTYLEQSHDPRLTRRSTASHMRGAKPYSPTERLIRLFLFPLVQRYGFQNASAECSRPSELTRQPRMFDCQGSCQH